MRANLARAQSPLHAVDANGQSPSVSDHTPLDRTYQRLRFMAFCADIELRIRIADPSFIVMPRLGGWL